ncbi:glycosyltransferase family 2 protein [Ornithinibacillus halotolerans]|uniref:Glycosyltransferase 2-like domain-containing protein n=1 Tax=Ornithinibacillus halotolerans TaxID=1274357 RepID=A0A916RPY7_9BACI|nr:glycosyltransferase family A protein [Ornithinibacillus halotolerans]GGA64701.1 hypothetical protein GCM10008025_05690 [Ornithinibacillus halotolerans]
MKKVITGPIDWFIFNIMNEKQRKRLGDIFSDEQKEKLKQIILGKQQLERQRLKQIRHHLYSLGFTDKGLTELNQFYENTKYPYLKKLAAWELALWYANDYSEEGAKKALQYIAVAKEKEKNLDQTRRYAIVEAECYDILGEKDKGKDVLQQVIEQQRHPDLFLGMANLHESIEERVTWINKAMTSYNLAPIYFENGNDSTYDDLRTESIKNVITDGPKVSVILPAFKAGDGIRIAIESILSQTWTNLELIVVDDCSPDNTADVIKEYVEKDPRVTLLSTPVNSGPYVARNIGLKHATGDFVTVNDSDDWSHAEKIAIQARHLMQHDSIIANTSEHARLTEEIKLYRRGTPGKYIFPNMSSLMFRREPVLEKIGNWDSVRFAADGEFKRRLIKVFGKNKYVDLHSGPLSLPRQSVNSLTGSSAFGYNGFFMGVRKEYVESLSFYHQSGNTLYYPYPMEKRPYPVPEPMWPKREDKPMGSRQFDIVIATDFRNVSQDLVTKIKALAENDSTIGLVQMNTFNLKLSNEKVDIRIRELIDGEQIQMLVFGENIMAQELIIPHSAVLQDKQRYVPKVTADRIKVIIDDVENVELDTFKNHATDYFSGRQEWFGADDDIVNYVKKQYPEVDFHLIDEDWKMRNEQ